LLFTCDEHKLEAGSAGPLDKKQLLQETLLSMHPVNEARGLCIAKAHQYHCGLPATFIR